MKYKHSLPILLSVALLTPACAIAANGTICATLTLTNGCAINSSAVRNDMAFNVQCTSRSYAIQADSAGNAPFSLYSDNGQAIAASDSLPRVSTREGTDSYRLYARSHQPAGLPENTFRTVNITVVY